MNAILTEAHLDVPLEGIKIRKEFETRAKGTPRTVKGVSILAEYDFTGCTLRQILNRSAVPQLIVDDQNLRLRTGNDGGAGRILNFHNATRGDNPWIRPVAELYEPKKREALPPVEKAERNIAEISELSEMEVLMAQLQAKIEAAKTREAAEDDSA
jgi:hypothetical protein